MVRRDRIQIADVDGPPLVRIVADFWPDRLLSDVRPVCADKVRWPRWCSLRTLQAHGRHSWCQCNLRKLARIDRSVLPSTASCKFVGNPPSNLARGPISDQVGGHRLVVHAARYHQALSDAGKLVGQGHRDQLWRLSLQQRSEPWCGLMTALSDMPQQRGRTDDQRRSQYRISGLCDAAEPLPAAS